MCDYNFIEWFNHNEYVCIKCDNNCTINECSCVQSDTKLIPVKVVCDECVFMLENKTAIACRVLLCFDSAKLFGAKDTYSNVILNLPIYNNVTRFASDCDGVPSTDFQSSLATCIQQKERDCLVQEVKLHLHNSLQENAWIIVSDTDTHIWLLQVLGKKLDYNDAFSAWATTNCCVTTSSQSVVAENAILANVVSKWTDYSGEKSYQLLLPCNNTAINALLYKYNNSFRKIPLLFTPKCSADAWNADDGSCSEDEQLILQAAESFEAEQKLKLTK